MGVSTLPYSSLRVKASSTLLAISSECPPDWYTSSKPCSMTGFMSLVRPAHCTRCVSSPRSFSRFSTPAIPAKRSRPLCHLHAAGCHQLIHDIKQTDNRLLSCTVPQLAGQPASRTVAEQLKQGDFKISMQCTGAVHMAVYSKLYTVAYNACTAVQRQQQKQCNMLLGEVPLPIAASLIMLCSPSSSLGAAAAGCTSAISSSWSSVPASPVAETQLPYLCHHRPSGQTFLCHNTLHGLMH